MHPVVLDWVCPAITSAPLCRQQPVWWWLAFLTLKGIVQDGILTAAILFIDHRHTTTTRKVLMVSRIIIAICFGFWVYQGVQTADWNLYVTDPAFGLYHCYHDAWVKRHVRRQDWSGDRNARVLEEALIRTADHARRFNGILKEHEENPVAGFQIAYNFAIDAVKSEEQILKRFWNEREGRNSVANLDGVSRSSTTSGVESVVAEKEAN